MLNSFFPTFKSRLLPIYKKNPYPVLLLLIVLVGLFFRLYKFADFYTFEHDQDLYFWIVKDMVVDKHIRLIGQLTSIEGIFIGPLFYYLLIPFFLLFKMNPLAAMWPVTMISVATTISIYYTFSKLFNRTVGLLGAILHTISVPIVLYERWVVPTQPTLLWSVWFLYAVFSLSSGNLSVLPILGLLVGLIWHIHVALLPLLVLIPVAFYYGNKKPTIKQLIFFALFLILVSLPFIIFELRHGFIHTKALLGTLVNNHDSFLFWKRSRWVTSGMALMMGNTFIRTLQVPVIIHIPLYVGAIYILWKKLNFKKKFLVLTFMWLAAIFLANYLSKRQISEYYFRNLMPLTLMIAALYLAKLITGKFKKFVMILLFIFMFFSFFDFILLPVNPLSFVNKTAAVDFIINDAGKYNYPCVGIDYIADLGRGVGFRYLYWWKNLSVVKPTSGAPVYKIVIPAAIAQKEITVRYQQIGVIVPEVTEFRQTQVCKDEHNQLDTLLGFTK